MLWFFLLSLAVVVIFRNIVSELGTLDTFTRQAVLDVVSNALLLATAFIVFFAVVMLFVRKLIMYVERRTSGFDADKYEEEESDPEKKRLPRHGIFD